MTRRAPTGFTVMELLLALLLTSFLTAALSVMLGQAARDRRAMQRPASDPLWVTAAFDVIERDLRNARSWAGADERLVLIGLGRDGLPAQIEYAWRDTTGQAAWVRQETPLTTPGQRPPKPTHTPVAVGLSGVMIGPHRFGDDLTEHIPDMVKDSQTSRLDATGGDAGLVYVMVAGRRVPLRSLPNQLNLVLAAADAPEQAVTRKVVLR